MIEIFKYACMFIFSILLFTGLMIEFTCAGFEDVMSKHAVVVWTHVGIGFGLVSFIFLFIAAIIAVIEDGDI